MIHAGVSVEAPSPLSQKGSPLWGENPLWDKGRERGPRAANVQIAPSAGGGGEGGEGGASGPDLAFRVDGMPPRRTLQAGRGAYVKDGEVRFFTREGTRAEAWEMRAEFRRQLPEGWTARGGPVKVRVELVYPLRNRERERLEGAGAVEVLLPHVERPDADNIVKSLLDSMTRAGVWLDDAQVCDLRVRKWRGVRPRWAVFVWFLPLPALPRRRRRGPGDGPEQGRLALGPLDAMGEGDGAGEDGGACGLPGHAGGAVGGQDAAPARPSTPPPSVT
jgi:Holliday junction resolvase RusA-like endonuclease